MLSFGTLRSKQKALRIRCNSESIDIYVNLSHRHEADVCTGALSKDSERSKSIDFTTTVLTLEIGFAIRREKTGIILNTTNIFLNKLTYRN